MRRYGLAMLVLLALLLGAATAQAEAALTDEPTLAVELGYGGTIAYMREMPIALTVTGGSRDVEGVVTLDVYRNQTNYDRYEYPVQVAARATQRLFMPVKLMMRQPEFHVRLESGGEVLAEATAKPARELGNNAVLVGVLSKDPQSLYYMNMNAQTDMDMSSELWSTIALDERNFPDTVERMSAFNLLAVDGFDPRTLSERQQDALRQWIAGGGIAIVGGGAGAQVCYPFFQDLTGLQAGGLVEATDVPRALMAHWLGLDTPSMAAYMAQRSDEPAEPGSDLLSALPASALMINQPTGEAAPAAAGQYPVLYRAIAGRGAVLTATFELGAKPLAQWDQMRRAWPYLLNQDRALSQIYRGPIERQRDYGYGYNDDNLSYMATSQRVKSGKSAAPALVLLSGYLLLAGAISYLVLKRLDKREFMWLTVPVLAMVFALSVRALGARMQFDLPLGATITAVSYDAQGDATVKSAGALTTNAMQPVEIRASLARTIVPAGMRDDYYNSYDYNSNLKDGQKAPTKLKYRFLMGDEPGVVMPNEAAWSVFAFNMPNPKLDLGAVTGRAWMEDDGLHAEIKNQSGQLLSAGALISNIGFSRMGELADGQTGTAFLKQTEASAQGMLAAPQQPESMAPVETAPAEDADDWTEEEGELPPEDAEAFEDEGEQADDEDYGDDEAPEEDGDQADEAESEDASMSSGGGIFSVTTGGSSGYGYSTSYGGYGSSNALTALPVDGELRAMSSRGGYMDYDYLSAIAHPDAKYDPLEGVSWDDKDPEHQFLGDVYHNLNNEWNRWAGYGYGTESAAVDLHYIALMDQLPAPALRVDGLQVEQAENRAFVDVPITFEPVGPTGVVCYLPGMLLPKQVIGELPQDPTTVKDDDLEPTDRNTSYSSSGPMDFVFELMDGLDIAVESLELSATAEDSLPTMALYNAQTKTWDERKMLYEHLIGAEAEPYVASGRIFVRMIPDTQTVSMRNYYGGVSAPSMALKGRLK